MKNEKLTQEEILNLTALLNTVLVDMEESLESGPWSTDREKYSKELEKYNEIHDKLIRMSSEIGNDQPEGIHVGKAYDFLFEGDNADYDEKYADYISDDDPQPLNDEKKAILKDFAGSASFPIDLNEVRDKYSLEELIAKATPENRHEEVDFGSPVGKEFGAEEPSIEEIQRALGLDKIKPIQLTQSDADDMADDPDYFKELYEETLREIYRQSIEQLPVKDGVVQLDPKNPIHREWFDNDDDYDV